MIEPTLRQKAERAACAAAERAREDIGWIFGNVTIKRAWTKFLHTTGGPTPR
jgi:hypothetical protein